MGMAAFVASKNCAGGTEKLGHESEASGPRCPDVSLPAFEPLPCVWEAVLGDLNQLRAEKATSETKKDSMNRQDAQRLLHGSKQEASENTLKEQKRRGGTQFIVYWRNWT